MCLCSVPKLGYFICFYFTVNPDQIAMWDSGFLIEVYSSLCQALGQCRWEKKGNEKWKKHGSSENVSDEKRREGRRGSAWEHIVKYLNPPTTPPTSRKHVKMSKFAGADSREFAGWTSCEQCFPRWRSRFPYLGHLSKTGRLWRYYMTCPLMSWDEGS